MRKFLALVGVLVALGVLLAACGSDDSNDDNTTQAAKTTTTAASSSKSSKPSLPGTVTDKGTKTLSGTELDLETDDFYFKPTFVDAKGGTKVSVKIENEGSATHTFTIDSLNIDEQLNAGDSKTVEVTLPASGTVNWYCRFHRSQGMQGAFVVSG